MIRRATLSGTQHVTIVTTNLYMPRGIDLDRRSKIVFWVDAVLDRVESVDYHGNNRKQLSQPRQFRFFFFGVTLLSSHLFVSDRAAYAIYKFNATNASGTVVSNVTFSQEINGLVAYDSSRQLPGIH